MNARDIIKAEYGDSKNFITPHVIKIVSIVRGRVAAELSHGRGIEPGTWVVGVSVASVDEEGNSTREHELSTSFSAPTYGKALRQAESYIDDLRERLEEEAIA